MGMSIDEAIEIISDIDKAYRTFSNMEYKAMQKSIDVMRKYQKIVGIVSLNDEEFKQCGLKELKEILEVIADGNDD